MEALKQALKQVKHILFFVSFFTSLVNALLVLLFSALIFFFFNVSWIYAFVPFLLSLGIFTVKGMRKVGYYEIERKIPDLEWRLRTSADNADRNDELAEDLHKDVLERLHQVSATRIMNKKQAVSRMAAVFGLCFLLLFLSLNSIHFDDLSPFVQKGTDSLTGLFVKATNLTEVSFLKKEEDSSLYGEEEQIKYGKKEEIVELNQMLGLADLQNYNRDAEGKTFKGTSTGSGNQEALGSENSKEKIGEEDKEIVNNYFRSINQP